LFFSRIDELFLAFELQTNFALSIKKTSPKQKGLNFTAYITIEPIEGRQATNTKNVILAP